MGLSILAYLIKFLKTSEGAYHPACRPIKTKMAGYSIYRENNMSFKSPNQNSKLQAVGLCLTFLGVAVAILSIFAAIPPFHFGIFYQSEPVVIFIHIGSGISATGLAIAIWANPRNGQASLHPFVIIPLCLAALTLVNGLFLQRPMASYFGSPQLGEGLFTFIDIAILTAATLVLKVNNKRHLHLGSLAVATTVIVSTLMLAPKFVSFPVPAPYFFPDYLAFYGILVSALIFTAFEPKSLNLRILLTVLAVLLGGGIVFASANRGAVALFFFGTPILIGIFYLLRFFGRDNRIMAAALSVLAPVTVTSAVILFGSNLLGIQRGGSFYFLLESTQSRFHLIEVAINGLIANPYALFTGLGWGSFTEVLSIHLPVAWVNLRDDLPQITATSWDAINRVDFHSHNYLVESALALGIPGVILALASTAMVPAYAAKRHRPIAVITAAALFGTWSLWFQVPASIPVMAVTWAFMAAPINLSIRNILSSRSLAVTFSVLGILSLFAGIDSWRFSMTASSFQPRMPPPLQLKGAILECPAYFYDTGRGGAHAGFRLRVHLKNLQKDISDGLHLKQDQIEKLNGLICASEAYIDKNPSFSTQQSSLLGRADIAFVEVPATAQPTKDAFLSNWKDRLNAVLKIAPNRTDLAASYLLWLLKENRLDEFSEFSAKLYAMDSSDPVGLWFSGIDLLGRQETAEAGLRRMQTALKLGIERFIPVDDQLKQQLTAQ